MKPTVVMAAQTRGATPAIPPLRQPTVNRPRWTLPGFFISQLTHRGHTVAMRSLPTDGAVRAAAARLRANLAADGLGTAVAAYFTAQAFAGLTFSNPGRNPPDEITSDDLLAVTLLDITWRPHVVRTLLGSQQREISALLA